MLVSLWSGIAIIFSADMPSWTAYLHAQGLGGTVLYAGSKDANNCRTASGWYSSPLTGITYACPTRYSSLMSASTHTSDKGYCLKYATCSWSDGERCTR